MGLVTVHPAGDSRPRMCTADRFCTARSTASVSVLLLKNEPVRIDRLIRVNS
jgi:hypothetical protein